MSLAESMTERPPRVSLQRLDDPTLLLEAQYNPTELSETVGAAYAKLTVPGLSHQVKQFTNTLDISMKFRLSFTAIDGPAQADALIAARLFFKTSVRPRRAPGDISHAGAPRIYMFWPNFFTMTCVIVNADLKYTAFNATARPIRMDVDVTVEEIRDTLILADDFFSETP